jgi:hypothetical protein
VSPLLDTEIAQRKDSLICGRLLGHCVSQFSWML